MKIYILRHGETDLNAAGVMQGRLDEPLNKNGRYLAEITGRAMRDIRFDRCISSPLVRAKETARIILRESGGGIPITEDERITEIDFGQLEGKPLSEMGDAGRLFFSDPFGFRGFPGGENVREVCERTQDFLKELIAANDGGTYLISTHGCAARAMINYLFEDRSDFWRGHAPFNCSVSIVESSGGVARISEIDRVFYDPKLIVDRYKR